MKKLYGIGIGPGDKELITLKGYNLIRSCEYVFIPRSKGESLAGTIASEHTEGKKVVELDFPMGEDNSEKYREAAGFIENLLKDGEKGVFLTLGDPMTYSTFIYLMAELVKEGVEVETVPGITSFSAAASRLNLPITMKDESFYLCDGNIDEEILKRVNCICILKVTRNKQEILEKLERNNFKYTYIRRCTQENEKILQDRNEILEDKDYMSLIYGRRG